MSGPSTKIADDLLQEKKFTFDYSFCSHNCYIELPSDYLSPYSYQKYVDQKLVFHTLGFKY